MIDSLSGLFASLILNLPWLLKYFGWLPLFMIAMTFENKTKPSKNSPLYYFWSMLGVIAILWCIGLLTHYFLLKVAPYVQTAFGYTAERLAPTWTDGTLFQVQFGWIDEALQPATANMLLAAALVLFMILLNTVKAPRWRGAVVSVFVILALIANSRIVLAFLDQPLDLLPLFGFMLGARSLATGKSSILNILQGAAQRGLAVKDAEAVNYSLDLPLRLLFVWMLVAVFWYPVTISVEIQIAFYSAAIGGLMAVIGFAALLFTFSYEQIKASRLRRDLARNTSEFQSAALPVVIASIFGLATATGGITFQAAGTSVEQAIRAALALCAFSGLIISTQLIMRTFHEFTLGMASLKRSDAIANIFIEESLSDSACSSSSEHGRGLLEFINLMEDQGCNITRIDGLSRGALLSSRRSILILPPSKAEVPAAMFEDIAMFVFNGGILLVLTGSNDLDRKAPLLKALEFPAPIKADEDGERAVICLKPGLHYGKISGVMSTGLTFRCGPVIPIVAFADDQDFAQGADPVAPVVAKRYQYGWVVVATSLKPFENATINTSHDSRFATEFLDVLLSLFPIGEKNFSEEMKQRFSEASSGREPEPNPSVTDPETPQPQGSGTVARPLLPFDGQPGVALTREEVAEISRDLVRGRPGYVPLDQASGSRFDLPFYPGCSLLRFQSELWTPTGANQFFLDTGSDLIPLEGQSKAIHMMNKRQAPLLSAETVMAYLAFFCFFVHGEAGPFFVVDTLETTLMPDAAVKALIQEVLIPPRLLGQDLDGNWLISATIFYADNLFHAKFKIRPNGMVYMEEDRPLKGGLGGRMTAHLKPNPGALH